MTEMINIVPISSMTDLKNIVPVILKNLREKHRFTQAQIASEIGINRKTYVFYENGETVPNLEVLMSLSDLYSVSIDELIGRELDVSKTASKALVKLNELICQLPLDLQLAIYFRVQGWLQGLDEGELFDK